MVPPAAAVAATRSASDSILRCRKGKIFFEKAFSEARMKPYFDRYPGDEARGEMLNKLHQT